MERVSIITGEIILTPPKYSLLPLPPAMPPWWAFWREPEERWQIMDDAGTMMTGPLPRQEALDTIEELRRKAAAL